MRKFFSGLLVTILVVEILGGLGYASYSMLFAGGSHGSMSIANNTAQNNTTQNSTAQNQTSTQGNNSSHDSMNMQSNSMNTQGGSMNVQNDSMITQGKSSDQSTLQQVNYALQNKDGVDRTISMLNDVVKSITMESYTSSNEGNSAVNSSMADMGVSYDPVKMEQFHIGLYKLTAGIENLKQIEEELMRQAEQAADDAKDKTAYYTNQYSMTLQSKSRLNQALYDINEASSLLNINPYTSPAGTAYEKDRMQQIHGNVLKLAQSVTTLNKLSSDMTKQAVTLIGTAQTHANKR